VPCFESPSSPLARLLPDRGTADGGRPERQEYELDLAGEGSDQTRTKGKSPQPKGSGQRLHQTVRKECYRIGFRKRLSPKLEDLPADLEMGRREDNEERPPHGRWWFGRTPLQTCRATMP
jgi:hypothetical protein